MLKMLGKFLKKYLSEIIYCKINKYFIEINTYIYIDTKNNK